MGFSKIDGATAEKRAGDGMFFFFLILNLPIYLLA